MNSLPRNGLRAVSAEATPAGTVEVGVFDLLDGPTPQQLAAIEAESPVITAGLELLDVEIALLDRPMTELDVRRLRRAQRRLIAAELAVYSVASNAPSLKAVG